MNTAPTTEERVWAVLVHLSALGFGMGILLPVVGWSEQRRKSKYVSFHSLQALGYQSLGFTVWMLSMLLISVVLVVLFSFLVTLVDDGGKTSELAPAMFGTALGIVIFGLIGSYFVLPILAAVMCGMGRDFRYPLLGNRLAKYLGYEDALADEGQWLIEDHEERWVASMGHFAVIIYLWGILAPLTAWIVQGKRSFFLKFQSIQTVVYQGIVTILYLASGFIYMFGFVALIALVGMGGAFGAQRSGGMLGMIILIVSMLVAAVLVMILPLFHILGQWAGYRVLKGDDYRYPLIGRLLTKWVKNQAVPATDHTMNLEGKPS